MSERLTHSTLTAGVRADALKVGDRAPPFEVQTGDGETIRLRDFAGRYVLLDFWATWCGPCLAETPHLKETYQAFGDDPRFAMIGLSLDSDIAAPRGYAEQNGLGWIQAFLGDWSKTRVPAQYGITGIPSIMLIDPEGKVIAQNLRGERIKAAVAEALGSPEGAD
jgi:peroxiredoxin